jgi:hypothetical protein
VSLQKSVEKWVAVEEGDRVRPNDQQVALYDKE